MLPTFEKRTSYKGLYGENDGSSIYGESGARNIYSNYHQMRAYVECFPNQPKNNYTLSAFPSSNRQNFEDFGKVLAVSVSEFYWSIAVQLYQPTLIRWLSLLYVYKWTTVSIKLVLTSGG